MPPAFSRFNAKELVASCSFFQPPRRPPEAHCRTHRRAPSAGRLLQAARKEERHFEALPLPLLSPEVLPPLLRPAAVLLPEPLPIPHTGTHRKNRSNRRYAYKRVCLAFLQHVAINAWGIHRHAGAHILGNCIICFRLSTHSPRFGQARRRSASTVQERCGSSVTDLFPSRSLSPARLRSACERCEQQKRPFAPAGFSRSPPTSSAPPPF